ncbi:MAG: glycogen/starch synthase [Bacteroidetes bacterium]|nr:glycogen/starch synthase [Bacteroidota bacterium]
MEKKKVLFISQEMTPYLATGRTISEVSRSLPQAVMDGGYEIRNFMPRFGCINERRHQLHEVIRLSGMNIVVNDMDQPLIIKVASIPSARTQVYFIDNEEYFKRKHTTQDEKGKFFVDNDERAIFFARGVFETVKKLGWSPDIIHCHGWMTSLVPVYLKNLYHEDPLFQHTKVVQSLYCTDVFSESLDVNFPQKVLAESMVQDLYRPTDTSYESIIKESLRYTDAVVSGLEPVSSGLLEAISAAEHLNHLKVNDAANLAEAVISLYEEILENSFVGH